MPSPKRKPRVPKKKGQPSIRPTKKTSGNVSSMKPTADALLSRATTTSAQLQRVIAALRTGPQTTHDLRCLGIFQCPARVKQLRDEFGYTILTRRVTLVDRDGYVHLRAGQYELVAEPKQFELDFEHKAANDPGMPRESE